MQPTAEFCARLFVLTVVLVLSTFSHSLACIRCEADDPDIRAEAEAGNARAQYVLAWKYATGYNADRDAEQSFAWLRKAADSGYEHAVLRLGEYYLKGRGIKRDVPAAIALLEKAAALFQGGEAAGLLADIYGTGEYIDRDRVSAHKWLSLSQRKGKDDELKNLERSMTAGEISAARAFTREWIEQNKDNPPPRSYDFAP